MKNTIYLLATLLVLGCSKKEDISPKSINNIEDTVYTSAQVFSISGRAFFVATIALDTIFTPINDSTINYPYNNDYDRVMCRGSEDYTKISEKSMVFKATTGGLDIRVFQTKQYTTKKYTEFFSNTYSGISMIVGDDQIKEGQSVDIKTFNGNNDTLFVTCKFNNLKAIVGVSHDGLPHGSEITYSGNFVSYYVKK